MQNIKAIFFDIDDTLYSTYHFARAARLSSVQGMIDVGLNMDVDECFKEYMETIDEFGSNYGSHIDKMLKRIPRERYEGVNPAVIIAAGVVSYHKTKAKGLVPYDDVVEVFKILHRHKVKIGIITEGWQIKQAEKLVRLGLLDYIDSHLIFITDQIGIGKKNPKLYLRAAQESGFAPSECVQVGDNPLKDIDPANKAGFITVFCRRSGKHKDKDGETLPDYTITNMWELFSILRDEFGFEF